MGAIGEAIVPQSAMREGGAFVRSISLVDCSIIAEFPALITGSVHGISNCGAFSSL